MLKERKGAGVKHRKERVSMLERDVTKLASVHEYEPAAFTAITVLSV